MGEDKKKDEKGGALPPWMSSAARPQTAGFGQLMGAKGASGMGKLGVLSRLQPIFASKSAVAMIMTAGLGVSAIGLYDMYLRGGVGMSKHRRLPSGVMHVPAGAPPDVERGLYGGRPASALQLAQQANQGTFGEAAPGEEGAEADAMAEDGEGEDFTEEGALDEAEDGAEDASGAAGDLAEALRHGAGAAKGGLPRGKLSPMGSTFGGGGSGASASSARLGGGKGSDPKGAKTGKLKGMSRGKKAKTSRRKVAARAGRSGLKGRAARRLSKMQGAMANAGPNPEVASAVHSGEWDNAGVPGSGIAGAGPSGIGGGSGTGATGTGAGSPIDSGTQGSGSGHPAAAPDPGPGENMTPYQGMVDMATILLAAASVLLALAYLCGWLAKKPSFDSALWYKIAKWLAYAAMAVAAIVTLLGIAIMATSGQMLQGGIFTGVGALLTFLSYTAAEGFDKRAAAAEEASVIQAEPAVDTAHQNLRPWTQTHGGKTIATDFWGTGLG